MIRYLFNEILSGHSWTVHMVQPFFDLNFECVYQHVSGWLSLQTTNHWLRTRSLGVQNCLLQWLLIPVLYTFLVCHPQHIGVTHRLVLSWPWNSYSTASNPDTTTTDGSCWFLYLFLLEQEIFPRSLPEDCPPIIRHWPNCP